MRSLSWSYKTILLIFLFGILVIGGRYVFIDTISQKESVSDVTVTEIIQDDKDTTSPPPSTKTKEIPPLSCIDELKKKVADEKLDYDGGSILVGFNTGVTLDEAIQILSMYGSVIRDMQYAREHYDERRLVTASVKSGEEFSQICTIKKDADVRYAGLNVLFSLHE